mmetsp:Transcript_419/g.1434  ORF Transcript_419/g.1434 Transcript_419/m.1434 type:complete len:104 (-) Transcript_419:38-349(-)
MPVLPQRLERTSFGTAGDKDGIPDEFALSHVPCGSKSILITSPQHLQKADSDRPTSSTSGRSVTFGVVEVRDYLPAQRSGIPFLPLDDGEAWNLVAGSSLSWR